MSDEEQMKRLDEALRLIGDAHLATNRAAVALCPLPDISSLLEEIWTLSDQIKIHWHRAKNERVRRAINA